MSSNENLEIIIIDENENNHTDEHNNDTTSFKDAVYEGISLNIQVIDDAWQGLLPKIETFCPAIINTVFSIVVPKHTDAEIAIVLADNDFIHDLNVRYCGKDKPTNVLSFPSEEVMDDDGVMTLGDIIFGREIIEEESVAQGKKISDHFTHLLVHGTLHLLGFNHTEELEASEMESLEIKILQEFNIKNPYEYA